MTNANTQVIAKVAAVVAGLALVLTAFVPAAQAQTADQLQAQIAALQAQIAALSGGASASVTFTRDLTIGSTGADVTALQTWLISGGYSIPAGATGYFGTQTQAAVAAYQAANGISPTAGYFGPITRAKVNASGGGSTGTPGTPVAGLQGGAGDLEDFDFIASINNEDVGEGQDDVEVLGAELEADQGSDLAITAVRVEFKLAPAQTGSDDLDDYADEVTILLDGKKVGSTRVRDMSESGGVWSRNITLDAGAIVRRNDVADLTVAVTALSNIDSTDLLNNAWRVAVSSIRYVDAQGAVVSETQVGDLGTVTTSFRTFEFSTFASANDVELRVGLSSDNPDAGTIEVDEDGGDEVPLLIGELRGKGSDIEITELTAVITPAGGASLSEIASEFVLVIDGDEVATIDADECTNAGDCNAAATGAATYIFEDFEFVLDEGDTVDFEIRAILLEFAGDFEQGDSLTASVSAAGIEAEDEGGDDLTGSELKGSAGGEAQSFFSGGINVKLVGNPTTDVTTVDGGVNDPVTFTWVVDITAFGDDDVFINAESAGIVTTSGATDVDILYGIELSTGAGLVAPAGTITTSSSNANVEQGVTGSTGYAGAYTGETFFRIREGRTGRFTITVSGTNQTQSKQIRALLNNIEWTTDLVNTTTVGTAQINNYTAGLGTEAATPFKLVN